MIQTRSFHRWFLCLAALWVAAGCATTSPPPPLDIPAVEARKRSADGYGWWTIRFRMDRPAEKTHWERDLIIAHRVLAKLITTHGRDIELWRFHRRSAPDESGHQFSFLFYTGADTADKLNRAVGSAPLVAQLLSAGEIAQVLTDAVDQNDRPDVEDTSDAKWSPVMQRSWPHYIMGVSRMWLDMVDQVSKDVGTPDDPSMERLVDHYRQVNETVTRIWQDEGYHALLHHLNAIYGYGPLVYWEKRWKSF